MRLSYGHLSKLMSSEGKVFNSCLVYIMLMEKHLKFLQLTIIAYDLKACRDLDSRSIWRVKCHWKKHGKLSHHTMTAYDLRMYHDLYPRSFIQVQGHWKTEYIFSVLSDFSYGKILEALSTQYDYLWPEAVSWFYLRSFLQVQSNVLKNAILLSMSNL